MIFAGLIDGFIGTVLSPFSAVAGWAWDAVVGGIADWVAKALLLVIEWVWGVIDSATSPDLAAPWFAGDGELAWRVGALGLVVVVAMMLASAIQAALLGRPEQIVDTVRQAVFAIVATAVAVTVADMLVKLVDEAGGWLWMNQRDAMKAYLENLMVVFANTPMAGNFLAPFLMGLTLVAMLGLAIVLFTRSALLYLIAAFAPLVFSMGVLPAFRGATRKLIHLGVALIVSKLAIVIALCVAVQLGGAAGPADAAESVKSDLAAIGLLVTGFFCFLAACISPWLVYKLMPTVEAAAAGSGVAQGWARGAMTAAYAGNFVGGLAAKSAATKGVAGQHGEMSGLVGGGAAGGGGGSVGGESSPPSGGGSSTRSRDVAAGGSTSSSTSASSSPASTTDGSRASADVADRGRSGREERPPPPTDRDYAPPDDGGTPPSRPDHAGVG